LSEEINVKIHDLTIFKGEFETAVNELRDWIFTAEMDDVANISNESLDAADDWIIKMTTHTAGFTGALKAAKMKGDKA
jgi:hypothetical protein